jgi:hypothetical protein
MRYDYNPTNETVTSPKGRYGAVTRTIVGFDTNTKLGHMQK